jgi:hypothetical protein
MESHGYLKSMVSKTAVDEELLDDIWILSDLASREFFCFLSTAWSCEKRFTASTF